MRQTLHFVQISAIFSGVAELRKVFLSAGENRPLIRQGTPSTRSIVLIRRSKDGFYWPSYGGRDDLARGGHDWNPSFELERRLLLKQVAGSGAERLPLSDSGTIWPRAEKEARGGA